MTLQRRLAELREQARYSIRNSTIGLRVDPALVLALLAVAEAAEDFMTSERDSDEESDAYNRTLDALSVLERSLDNGDTATG